MIELKTLLPPPRGERRCRRGRHPIRPALIDPIPPGQSQPIGDWFSDAAAGVWLFTDNTDFFRGHVRSQDPLWAFQAHAGYNFRPGLWLAADGTYYTGGETSIDGVAKHDAQAVARYGLTLSVPLGEGFSTKLAWSSWLIAHKGGNFDNFGVTLQYRWFDQ